MHANQGRRGVISLLALILMATMTATAVGASLIIMNELRQTQAVDQAAVAVYAAESGVEQGLAIIRNARQTKTLSDTRTALDPCYNQTGCTRGSVPVSDTLPAATWQRSVSSLTTYTMPLLAPDQSVSVDYVDPDTSGASNVESLTLSWEDDCRGNTQIEASLLTWSMEGGQLDFSPNAQRVFKQVVSCGTGCSGTSTHCACATPEPITAFISPENEADQLEDLSALKPYRFTFRPIFIPGSIYDACVITNLKVTAYDAGATPTEIPTVVQLKAVGKYGNALQAVTAQLPWKEPASGLLSFVLFSEEDIQK